MPKLDRTERSNLLRDEKVGDFWVRIAADAAWVPLGANVFEIRSRFTIEPKDKARPLIDVEIEDGKAVCVAVRRRPGGIPLKTVSVRQPIDAFVKAAIRALAVEPTGKRSGDAEVWTYSMGRRRREDFEALLGSDVERRRGVRLPDAFFERVATAYREADAREESPTDAVGKRLHGSRSSAGRWVAEARRRGFLGAAIPRRAGERKRGAS